MPAAGGSQTAGSTSAGGSSAGGAAGTNGMAGTSAGGTSSGPQPLPRITGSQGFLTRFWDCCRPSCGKGNCTSDGKTVENSSSNACFGGGSGFACYNLAPFVDSTNQYVAYAFGATNPQECGACYEIQFTGRAGCSDMSSCPGSSSLLGFKTLYIQGLNTGSDVKQGQFDIMIPGGGVGMFNACSNEWGVSDLGSQNGGFFAGCNRDVTCYNNKCNSVFSSKPDLLAGCLWFSSWMAASDNPQITYTKVACPKQLSDRSGF